jgi:nucleotide-binding universal stress UspA family protein
MKPFQKILVPVDFSEHSAEAVRVAADLSRRFEASITLVHVYDPLVYALPDGFAYMPQPAIDQLLKAFSDQLAKTKLQALEAGAPRVETQVLNGSVAGAILDHATRGAFDLIVMGTHGRTGMQHVLIGSTAERVVRLATCPVLTVKKANVKTPA